MNPAGDQRGEFHFSPLEIPSGIVPASGGESGIEIILFSFKESLCDLCVSAVKTVLDGWTFKENFITG
jgi:hypothetical protein